jgi:hypothetical protein
MKATEMLRNLGQSLWLDNITRDLLKSGALKITLMSYRYRAPLDPAIFVRLHAAQL